MMNLKELEKIKVIIRENNPEKIIDKFSTWFDYRKKMAFFMTVVIGIIAHISMITNRIMSQDGVWHSMEYYKAESWEISLGRWGINLIESLNNYIAIPTVSTITSIIFFAMAVVFLVDLFEFKSKISIALTSLILILAPTFTITALYIYTASAYCANFLISILVVWFLYKFKYKGIGRVLSVLCFTISLSIYQSYIGVSIGLFVMMAILDLMKKDKSVKEVFVNIGYAILVVVLGGILYYLATKIILNINNLELANYHNYTNVNIFNILVNLKNTIIKAYKDFFMFFFSDNIVYNTNYKREILYGIFFGISAIVYIFRIISIDKKSNKLLSQVLATLFILILPIFLNIINILIVDSSIYVLTAIQMLLYIPFIFAIFEQNDKYILLRWGAIISCLLIISTYYIATNVSYAVLKLTYDQTYLTTVRIVDRIENTEGYNAEYPILIGGIVNPANNLGKSNLYNYTIAPLANAPVFHNTYEGMSSTWHSFLRIFFGLERKMCVYDDFYNIISGEEYNIMEKFPGKTSVKIIDETVVVKLQEAEEILE